MKTIKLNNSPFYWRTFFILLVFIFIIKIFIIYFSHINMDPVRNMVLSFLTDIPVFLIVLFLIRINTSIKKEYRIFIIFILSLIVIHFFIDIFSIYYFQSRALIPDIFYFLWEAWQSQYYLQWFTFFLLLLILAIISFFIAQLGNNKNNKKHILITLLILIILRITTYWILYLRNRDIKFLGNVYTLNTLYYKSDDIENYKNLKTKTTYENHLTNTQWDWKEINVILVFAESLSQIDSKRDWWHNNIPLFDKIQSKWKTFTNFISNWLASQSAHISTLQWIIPCTYHTYTWHKYIMEPLPIFFNQLRYNTVFISTVPLSFINQRQFLQNIWFKKIIWEDIFKDSPKYTFNAAPDEYLYKKAIEVIQSQTWNYFIWLQTISFHKPYNTPLWKTEELALQYSDQELYKFYENLEKIWFFHNGILIIIWDHRKMNPINEEEYNILWNNWYTKSVATIVWTWIKEWDIDNRIIQHTDFYNSIKKLIGKWDIKIDKHYNNVFNKITNRDFPITINPWKILNQPKYTIYEDWQTTTFNNVSKNNIKNPEIYEYLISFLKFQWSNLRIYQLTTDSF